MRRYKRIGTLLACLSFIAIFSACKFEPALTPIVWITPGVPNFGTVPPIQTPGPEPIPIPPTPLPPFDGAESLNCSEPAGGDNHFGYCRIPGTQDFYVWGECTDTCPEGQYAGIELMTLGGSETALNLYRDVINERDKNFDDRTEGWWRGGILGGLGVGGGAAGITGACILAGSWNFGVGCGLVLLGVGAAGFLSFSGFKDAIDANSNLNSPTGLHFSAQDLFEIIRSEYSPSN